jgi:RimJ/RimL family protein N-acetyltransferase
MMMVTLRTFEDDDIGILRVWLHTPLVARWFHHPDDWLKEVYDRHGEFSFIKHFIAEADGQPIGFCQYYDAFFGEEYEQTLPENDRYKYPRPKAIGEIYSIDYLVGEVQNLRRGYGSEMVGGLIEMIRSIPTARLIVVDPEDENLASCGVLTANGFVQAQNVNGDWYYRLEM